MVDFGEHADHHTINARVQYRIDDVGEKLHGVDSSRITVTKIPMRFARIDWAPYRDPQRVEERTIKGLEPALAEVDSYCADLKANYEKGRGMFLYSPELGTGKSSLGSLILINSQHFKWHKGHGELDWSAHYIRFQQLVKHFNKQGFEDSVWDAGLPEVDFLFVDEVSESEEKINPNSKLCMETLLRLRSEDSVLPTIISSNYTPDEFAHVFGAKASSFLNADCKHVFVPGSPYREEKAETLNPTEGV